MPLIKPRTRGKEILRYIGRLDRENVEALILGGTEIPLLLRAEEHNGIHFLDTTRIHVDRLIEEMLK